MLPLAISIGITEHDFWNMTMRSLNAHVEGYQMKRKEIDFFLHLNHIYTCKAVSVAIGSKFGGKSNKEKPFDKPLLQDIEEKNKPLTEEEIQKQREKFVMGLLTMQANFELNKKKDDF